MAVSGLLDIRAWSLRWPYANTVRSVGPDLRVAELEAPGLHGASDLTLPVLRAAEVEAPGLRVGEEL